MWIKIKEEGTVVGVMVVESFGIVVGLMVVVFWDSGKSEIIKRDSGRRDGGSVVW